MARRRNYTRYELRDHRKLVYRGITNRDPQQREQEHREEGKRFTSMTPVGPKVTRETADKWEGEALEQYRRTHDGRNPRYNKTEEG